MGIPGQSLRGLVGQGMDGRKKGFTGYTYQYVPGSFTFNAPVAGYWKFVLWGPGADATLAADSGSGAYAEITRFLGVNEAVTLVVGNPGTDTTATFANGLVVTAGKGSTVAGGTASNGDVNLSGSLQNTAGTGTGGGAAGGGSSGGSVPANLPFRGGVGGTSTFTSGTGPGAGGYVGGGGFKGSGGFAIALFARP